MKPNKILIGVIVVLVGLFGLMRSAIAFDFSMVTMLVIGLALVLLYRQKKSVWALFAGGYLTCVALMRILAPLGFGLSRTHSFALMFFVMPGAIFLFLYFDKNKRGLLVPACLMLWLGLYFIISGAGRLWAGGSFGVLIMCLGCGFCMAHRIGRIHLSKAMLILGLGMIAVGGLLSGGLIRLAGGGLPRLACYGMIAVGAAIIVKSLVGKNGGQ